MIACRLLASLVWQPGRHMDEGWWDALEMSAWRDAYRRYPACRANVDSLLIERRGWPGIGQETGTACMPPESDAARALLQWLPNLRRVALAFGLRVLGCPDYLLLGTYRRALSSWLDAWQCDRLLLTRQDWTASCILAPEALASAALTLTGAYLNAADRVRVSPSLEVAYG